MEIAVVRKLVKSQTYFVTVSEGLLPGDWREVAVTIAPLNAPWGSRKVTIVKRVGESRIYGSVKFVIPAPVVSHLGLGKGDYVWLRFVKGGGLKDEPPFPSIPFLADVRRIHRAGGSHFVLVSKVYLGRLVDAMGRGRWSGKIYLALRAPTGDVVRAVARVKDNGRRYNMYHVTLPPDKIKPVVEKAPAGKIRAYVVVAPLPEGYGDGVPDRPPPALPL